MTKRLAAFLLLFWISAGGWAQEWRFYGGNPGGTRFSSLQQINRKNVGALKRAWTYHTGEVNRQNETDRHQVAPFETTPLVVDGTLYLSTPSNRVIALDAETGREIWQFDPQAGRATRKFFQHRGVAYWQSKTGDDRRILYGTFDGRMICLDAKNGKTCGGFGTNGVVNLRAGVADEFPDAEYAVTSPPAIFKDLVITGAAVPEYPSKGPSGAVRAFDVHTGKLVWTFHTVPDLGETGHETWAKEASKSRTGVNVWSSMSVDVERDLVFLPIGSPSYDFYGGDRKGQNLFANSLVVLQASTGKLVWYFQMVHHDLWDYDMPAQPTLITVHQNGRSVAAVAEVTKMGFVFIFDRVTGRPLFPVEEHPVPESDVPGEAAWPTQPFPSKPPPLVRQRLSEADITTVTPEFHRYCAELFHSLESRGIYTPYGLKQTLVVPGTLGGATWSGGSFDPKLGYLFVNVNELGAVGAMEPQPAGSPLPYRRGSNRGEYARFWDQNQWPCQKPPWGTLNAIDVNKGEIVWKVPLGSLAGLNSVTGAPNLGASVVTAGGLVFIGATTDSKFRAFDSRTGKQLWVAELAASAHAAPVTYIGKKTHKQFVVIAAGGGGFFQGQTSDEVVAFALPN
ncbi:MAG TPA: pyrroloquinoline quinone-dependent dehydrogenase [Terriglobales bacterium]|jgi:quinoprotein glucose dehydrogenase|nr:pyrroloquinoline quinone-dependent dehydrogenase [Terriglobales bacterium]